jgi:hypothetical protein
MSAIRWAWVFGLTAALPACSLQVGNNDFTSRELNDANDLDASTPVPDSSTPDAFVEIDAAPIPDAPLRPDANIAPCAALDVDLLFLIDSSGSMREEQANLILELPEIVRTLSTGDRNDDGIVDFTPARSLHIGFVTSDMGSGDEVGVRSCNPGLGDDGILRSSSRGASPCLPNYPSGTFAFASGGDRTSYLQTLNCIADIGTNGCGFEQQLEAPLKALTPGAAQTWTRVGYVPPRFSNGTLGSSVAGHGLAANAGFLRPDSTLAIVLVTDEEDCSVNDYALFGSDMPFVETPLGLRCNAFEGDPTLVHPIQRYVDGFLGLRRSPSQLVFHAIVGLSPTAEGPASRQMWNTVLSDPGMQAMVNEGGFDMVPACMTANGTGYPGRRFVQVAQGLEAAGASVGVSSICDGSFSEAATSIVESIADGLPPECRR